MVEKQARTLYKDCNDINEYNDKELFKRLKKLISRKRGYFKSVIVYSSSSKEIPDDENLKLIILPPVNGHSKDKKDSKAIQLADEILNNCGNRPRKYRNRLIFLAINSEKDVDQLAEKTDVNIEESYRWILVPFNNESINVTWEMIQVKRNKKELEEKNLIKIVSDRLVDNEIIITDWSPSHLQLILNRNVWTRVNHISIGQLWKYIITYCFMPKLKNKDVLLSTINEGVKSHSYFAIAMKYDEFQNKYLGLVKNSDQGYVYIDDDAILVKLDVAQAQLDETVGNVQDNYDEVGFGEDNNLSQKHIIKLISLTDKYLNDELCILDYLVEYDNYYKENKKEIVKRHAYYSHCILDKLDYYYPERLRNAERLNPGQIKFINEKGRKLKKEVRKISNQLKNLNLNKIACPQCGSEEYKHILYGLPPLEAVEEAERGEVMLGGSIVSDYDPHYYCEKCDIVFA